MNMEANENIIEVNEIDEVIEASEMEFENCKILVDAKAALFTLRRKHFG